METITMFLIGVLIICTNMFTVHAVIPYTDVKSDYESLLAAYEMSQTGHHHDVIPKNVTSGPLEIYLDFSLYSLVDYDVVSGSLELAGTLNVKWQDDVKDLTGTTFTQTSVLIPVAKDQIWVPDLVVINSQDYEGKLGDVDDVIKFNTSTGECKWEILLAMKVACTPDVTYFPYDQHDCEMIVRAWLQDDPNIQLSRMSESLNTDSFEPSALWDITKTSVMWSTTRPHDITFGLSIKRNHKFHAAVILTPIVVISVLSLFAYLIPPFSQERVSFSASCFLAYIILLDFLTDIIPTVFFPVSLLCIFLFLMMMLNVAICIVNVIMMRIHFGKPAEKVPEPLKAFIRIITFRRCKKEVQNSPPLLERQDTVFNIRFPGKGVSDDLNGEVIEEIDEEDSVFELSDDDAVITDKNDEDENERVELHHVKSANAIQNKVTEVISFKDDDRQMNVDNGINLNSNKVADNMDDKTGDKAELESISSVETTYTTRSVAIKPTLAEEVYTLSFNTYLPRTFMSNKMKTSIRHDIVGGRPRSRRNGRKGNMKTDITPVEHSTLPEPAPESEKVIPESPDTPETNNDESCDSSGDRKDSGVCGDSSKLGTSVSDTSELGHGMSRDGKNDSDDGRTTVTRFSSSTKTHTTSTSSVSHKVDEITWNYVGQIFDYFFLLLFTVVQTIFMLAFVLPISSRN
ncbi:hypothetical protein ACF0H5_004188 [Mactra antiquata]